MDNKTLLIKYLKKKGHSKSSLAAYVYSCEKFITWAAGRHMDTEFMTYSELLDYIAYLRKRGIGQRTVQGYMIAITHYFEALAAAEIIPNNPARYLEIRHKQQRKLYPILNREQLEKLYTHFEAKPQRKTKPTAQASAIRNRITVGLMVFQGLEATTLSKLKAEDVDVLGGTINIRGGRTYNSRKLALQAVQIIELDRYINQTRKELQSHFKQEDNEALLITGYKYFRDVHKKLINKLRKQEPQLQSSQQIKASVITHWLKQYNLREVQYMAGHRRIQSTESYLQDDTEGLQIDIDRFHPMR